MWVQTPTPVTTTGRRAPDLTRSEYRPRCHRGIFAGLRQNPDKGAVAGAVAGRDTAGADESHTLLDRLVERHVLLVYQFGVAKGARVAGKPRFSLATVVVDCPDAHVLAEFYRQLLGWEVKFSEPDWVLLRCPDAGTGLSFQTEPGYQAPVWPERPEDQQKMLHLDIRVDDLDEAEAYAVAAGATRTAFQPLDEVRVLLDPAGHPFCLFLH
ncbi:VOC family protein [Streptomyces sp. NPDC054765]